EGSGPRSTSAIGLERRFYVIGEHRQPVVNAPTGPQHALRAPKQRGHVRGGVHCCWRRLARKACTRGAIRQTPGRELVGERRERETIGRASAGRCTGRRARGGRDAAAQRRVEWPRGGEVDQTRAV